MTKTETIDSIKARIPGMACLPGCTACCSHVPWSKTEWDALPEEVRASHSVHSMQCPFLGEGGCRCYDHRAFTCRIFGVSEDIKCPRGAVPGKLLTPQETAELSRLYVTLFKED